ncbi:MAG: hypothetical protein PW734_09825 [Verrucomicrobium sp.]|nr:hypothetical protein [Verrucomicrobium sp.]
MSLLLRVVLLISLSLLAAAQADQDPGAASAAPAGADSAPSGPPLPYPADVRGILDRFFGILKEGKASYAAEWLCGSNPLMSAKPDIIVKLKYVLGEFSQRCGSFSGFDTLQDQKLGDHVEYIFGLGIYKSQPAAFAFTFYNSGTGWMLQNFDLSLNVDEKIKQLVAPAPEPVKSAPPSAAPVTPEPATATPATGAAPETPPPKAQAIPAPASSTNTLNIQPPLPARDPEFQ